MLEEDIIIKDADGKKIESNKRLPLAILASFGGALIGLGVWVGIAALNFYSAWAALAIAWCAKYFYDKAKGPQNMAKFYSILAITIVVLLLSEYLSLYVQLLVNKIPGITAANTLNFVFSNFGLFAIDFILFVVFSILGTAAILMQTYREVNKNTKPNIRTTNFSDTANEDYEKKFKEFEENSRDTFDDDKFDKDAFDK